MFRSHLLTLLGLTLFFGSCSLDSQDPKNPSTPHASMPQGQDRAEAGESSASAASADTAAEGEKPEETAELEHKPEEDPWEAFNAILRDIPSDNLVVEIPVLRQLAKDHSQNPDLAHRLAFLLFPKLCAIGRYAEAHEVYDRPRPTRPPAPKSTAVHIASLEDYEARDALLALAKVTKDAQVVMINEAHHVPQHRALSLQLLPILREQDFTHFAAETLYDSDRTLDERKYPTGKSGYLIDEPLYGDLVRSAYRLGFRVVPYEAVALEPQERESKQARNLIERILAQDPDARIFVHLGYDHNRESAESSGGIGAMAYHFERLTGIDPLTIDQSLLTERSAPDYEPDFYRYLAGNEALDRPTAFVSSEGELWHLYNDDRDVTLFHPRSRLGEHDRPTWLEMDGLRRAFPLPDDLCGAGARCLVEARYQDEGADAIPIDRLIVEPGEPAAALMLSVGRFDIEARNAEGTIVHSTSVTVQNLADQLPPDDGLEDRIP